MTRFIAVSLREAGYSVLAKTTGSRPMVILPDGREEEIKRKGIPSILEGKKILRQAVHSGAQALVTEMMSIQPECLFVEAQRLFRPQFMVVTNVRLDHREEMGKSKQEIAEALSRSIQPEATVFLPRGEHYPGFEERARRVKAKIIRVDMREAAGHLEEENKKLALVLTEYLGVQKETALQGMTKAVPDFGSLRLWQMRLGSPPAPWIMVSAFAANDPESTRRVIDEVKMKLPWGGRKMIGLLNLRRDRGDRTVQWLEALEGGHFADLEWLFLIGGPGHALRVRRYQKTKQAPGMSILEARTCQEIMEKITQKEIQGGILFGLGNMGGWGAKLVRYWEEKGQSHEF